MPGSNHPLGLSEGLMQLHIYVSALDLSLGL